MKSWQKWVLVAVFVGAAVAAVWFFLGTEEPMPEVGVEPLEEETQ